MEPNENEDKPENQKDGEETEESPSSDLPSYYCGCGAAMTCGTYNCGGNH